MFALRKILVTPMVMLALVISALPVFADEQSDLFGVGDLNIPAKYNVATCTSAVDLDCIESVGLTLPSGEYRPGVFSEYRAGTKFLDPYDGNLTYDGRSVWLVDGQEMILNAKLESPKNVIYPGHTGASLKIYPTYPEWRTKKFKIIVRTSWLRPMNVQVKAEDANFLQEKISGGNRWTIEGLVMNFSDYDVGGDPATSGEVYRKKMETQPKADFDEERIEIGIHHAGKNEFDSYWPPICADQGYSVQSNNTNATGDPVWTGESLEFAIQAPHLKSTGEMNTGYFRFAASHKFLDCKFPGNLLTKSPKVELQIFDEGGEQKVATTVVDNSNGMLIVEAKGFHFSAPKIRVKPVMSQNVSQAQGAATKPQSMKRKVTIKKKTITCSKGKSIRKVSGINPQCPRGYALKDK
jgi:hypothetical protein